jgi:hypothetical protein
MLKRQPDPGGASILDIAEVYLASGEPNTVSSSRGAVWGSHPGRYSIISSISSGSNLFSYYFTAKSDTQLCYHLKVVNPNYIHVVTYIWASSLGNLFTFTFNKLLA